MLSQLTQIKSEPLDVMLFAIGVRLSQLANSNDEKFKSLLENRSFTIQMGSEAEQHFRHYKVDHGKFEQIAGKAEDPTLSITFKDAMTGAKLLSKGEATAFMTGIQNGDLKMAGDYSLLMWFNQISKFIVPKVPEPLKPVVEQAKPLLEKAMPIAQGLCAKVAGLFGASSVSSSSAKSKYFNDSNTPKDVTNAGESKLDTLKAKATELKEEAVEKFDEIKTEAKEKLDTLKDEAEEKLAEVKETVNEKTAELKDKAQDLEHQAEEKLADVKQEVKDTAVEKAEDVKEQAEDVKSQVEAKLENTKSDEIRPDNVFAKSVDNENLTPAMRKSAEIEAKHADEEVIAEDVITKAVKDDKSPITNITVTRAE
ncbi:MULTISPECIES: hypothetical protein [unclassified Moraxella]|uniref:hypothetical protein n=1 Tax=unclassified Moraxella TaxID=2685852 RepID=UPI003AF550FD